jgi:hypothetical protein
VIQHTLDVQGYGATERLLQREMAKAAMREPHDDHKAFIQAFVSP